MLAPRLLAVTLGSLLALAPAAADAAPLDTAGMTGCDTHGYATDLDPKGTNLRAAPRADAPIIGHMAPRVKIDTETWTGVTFDILGARNGWFLIRNPSPIDGIKLIAANAEDGRAWVSATLVGTTLGTPIFRSAPQRDAPMIMRMTGGNWGPYTVAVLAVHACSGRYVEVTARPPDAKPVRGWAFGPCSAQLTTCDVAGEVE